MRHDGEVTVIARPATASDASRLAEVAALTFPLACPPGTQLVDIARFVTTVLSEGAFEGYLADPARRVLLVVDDHDGDAGAEGVETTLGYAMLVGGEPADAAVADVVPTRPTVELSKFYLVPDQHGSGAAGVLMGAVLDAARSTRASSAWLGVNQENARARAFYAKHGFERVGVKQFVVGAETHDDFVLARTL